VPGFAVSPASAQPTADPVVQRAPQSAASVAASGGPRFAEISFVDALSSVEAGPEGAAEAAAVRAQRRLAQALSGFSENPELAVYPGWRFAGQGADRPEVQVQITQGFSLGGLSDARAEALRAEGETLRALVGAARLGRRLAVARAWIEAHATAEAERAAVAALARADHLSQLFERAAEAGVITADAVAEVALERAEAHLRRVDAEGLATEAAYALGAALPAADAAPRRPLGPLPTPLLPPEATWSAALGRAERLPEAAAARLAIRVAETREAEVRAAAATRLSAGLMAQSDNGDVQIYGLLSATLPIFDAGARERAGLRAEARLAEGRATAAARAAVSALAVALHEVSHRREVEQTLEQRVLPAARTLAERRARALAVGQSTAFDALRAEVRLAQVETARVRAAADRAWAEVQAWVLLDAVAAVDEAALLPAAPPNPIRDSNLAAAHRDASAPEPLQ
jgi:outer membrane protein TolC